MNLDCYEEKIEKSEKASSRKITRSILKLGLLYFHIQARHERQLPKLVRFFIIAGFN